jgi:hypothetical protein
MLCHAVLVRIDVSKKHIISIIRVTRIGELGTMLVTAKVPSWLILVILMMEAIHSSETGSYKSHMA